MPHKSDIRPAAAVLLARGEKIWLGRRGLTRFLPGFSVFPGGACEEGESFEEAARRELFEETGIELKGPLKPFARAITPPYSRYRFDVRVFLSELPEELEPIPDGRELVEGAWWTSAEALAARNTGRLQLAPPTYRQILFWQECREANRLPDSDILDISPPKRNEQVLPLTRSLSIVPLDTTKMFSAAWVNCALIGEHDYFIVDPGSLELAPLEAEMAKRQKQGHRPKGVILTHHHPDHVSGYSGLGLSELPLYCHPITGELLDSRFPKSCELLDQQVLQIEEGLTLKAHFSPGHAPGHLALELCERKTLLAGDMISSLSSIVIPSDNGSLPDYLSSLERLRELDCPLVIPSHGPPFGSGADPFGQVLKHRQIRERQIISILQKSKSPAADMVGKIYPGLKSELRAAALSNINHHLQKLESENKALVSGESWQLSQDFLSQLSKAEE